MCWETVSRDTYLDPMLLGGIAAVTFGLASIDGLVSLAGRSEILSGADGRSLPVLHLG